MAYDGSVELISGLKQANNSDFALVDATAVYVDDNTRLPAELNKKAPKANPEFTGSVSLGKAEGTYLGANSAAFGIDVSASAIASFAEGHNTIAYGNYSHAEGDGTSSGFPGSHSEGTETKAREVAAHAEGKETIADGKYSHAEGHLTQTTMLALGSHAEGVGTIASKSGQHVGGWYNVEDNTSFEIIGRGSGTNDRKNARLLDGNGNERLKGDLYVQCNDDSTGGKKIATEEYVGVHASDAQIYATMTSDSDNIPLDLTNSPYAPDTLIAGTIIFVKAAYLWEPEPAGVAKPFTKINYKGTKYDVVWLGQGVENVFDGETFVFCFDGTNFVMVANGRVDYISESKLDTLAPKASPVFTGSISLGRKANTTVGTGSFAFGYSVEASGSYSNAEGYWTKASGSHAHAEGNGTTASETDSHAEGYDTEATAQKSHAEGWETKAQGEASHAEGYTTIAAGGFSHTEGWDTKTFADASHAEGVGTIAKGEGQHVSGKYNVYDTTSLEIVGRGNYNENRKNARLLDANGNERLKGDLYVQCNDDSTGGKKLATEEYVQGQADAMIYKGVVNAASDLPATHKVGWTYKVATAGTYAGKVCEVGDMIICNTDGTVASDSDWDVIQTNINGAVTGPASSTNNRIALFDGTTGKIIKQSSYTAGAAAAKGVDTSISSGSSSANLPTTAAVATYVDTAVSSKTEIDDTAGSGETTKTWSADKITSELDLKAPKESPIFTESISLGRKADTTIGVGSFAAGKDVEASGNYSHAEGIGTKAVSLGSHAEGSTTTASEYEAHAEGYNTTASGAASHAEGTNTTASGGDSHAEGFGTTASQYCSHAEGIGTIANGQAQHVGGKYNITDNASLEIIGRGSSTTRKNARLLDADGNEKLKGDLYVQCNDDSTGGKKVATEEYVGNQLDVHSCDTQIYATMSTSSDNTPLDLTHSPNAPDTLLAGAIIFVKTEYAEDPEPAGVFKPFTKLNYKGTKYNVVWLGQGVEHIHMDETFTFYFDGTNFVMTANGRTEYISESKLGVANGVATLDSSTKVPLSQLQNIIDDTAGNGTTNKTWSANKLNTLAPKDSPVFVNSISLSRKANTTVGAGSLAVGDNTEASGTNSIAEGYYTVASGSHAHAEGAQSIASGSNTHAEGGSAAIGMWSHSEGLNTVAGGLETHAQGQYTTTYTQRAMAAGIANLPGGHDSFPAWEEGKTYVIGEIYKAGDFDYYCIKKHVSSNSNKGSSEFWKAYPKNTNTYIETVGNGSSSSNRSNARALDIDGNEYLKGDLYVQCNYDSTGGKKVVTEDIIDDTTGSGDTNKVWSADKLTSELSAKANKTATVSNVAYDSANKKITKTINGTTSDVVTASILKTAMSLNNVENKSSATIRGELTSSNVTTALGYTPPAQDTTYSNMTGATSSEAGSSGLVPAPAAGKQLSYLRGDGTWNIPNRDTIFTGTGTTGQAGSASAAYIPSLWTFDIGFTPVAGDIIMIKVPVAGVNSGVWISVDNGTTYYPVALHNKVKITTQYSVNMMLALVYETNATTTIYGTSTSGAAAGATQADFVSNRWTVVNGYDSNTTYSAMSSSEMTTGTATSSRAMTATNLKAGLQGILKASNGDVQLYGAHITGQVPAPTAANNGKILKIDNAIYTLADEQTYENKTAASGGTDVSLVTTGEKYTWNNKAPINSPVFTGSPKSVTPDANSDSTMIATKAYVDAALAEAKAYADTLFSNLVPVSGAIF